MSHKKYLLGIDLGSSSVKASLIVTETGALAGSCFRPVAEMPINSPQPGWAEQDPELWWKHSLEAIHELLRLVPDAASEVGAIGISYQMHGLVLLDGKGEIIRPSIIWCDSRAIDNGKYLETTLGESFCQQHLLNAPGNFTAAKLGWVAQNEPSVFNKTETFMLPGDYLAFRLTGVRGTTRSGLSEGMFWDFADWSPAGEVLNKLDARERLPEILPSFGFQGELTAKAAEMTGLAKGTPVSYRAGDQPNNALSLKAIKSGEVAATAGTSGVIYAVTDKRISDPESRVNTFLHPVPGEQPLMGVLLCINGTGISNRWIRELTGDLSYDQMNNLASGIVPGSDGLRFYPFGNGAERMLGNRQPGASFTNLSFNRHGKGEIYRAVQEGIAFSFRYGFEILESLGSAATHIRASKANMFLSPLFCELFTNLTSCTLEIYDTDGARGAAFAAGIGMGYYGSIEEIPLERVAVFQPDNSLRDTYMSLYNDWKKQLI